MTLDPRQVLIDAWQLVARITVYAIFDMFHRTGRPAHPGHTGLPVHLLISELPISRIIGGQDYTLELPPVELEGITGSRRRLIGVQGDDHIARVLDQQQATPLFPTYPGVTHFTQAGVAWQLRVVTVDKFKPALRIGVNLCGQRQFFGTDFYKFQNFCQLSIFMLDSKRLIAILVKMESIQFFLTDTLDTVYRETLTGVQR
ncbi:hypothetical protein C163_07170 [Pseudomonas sp. FGI182]|nr:hypothetical protein C163_07170 [Pseudomonas sp. FGI182]